MRIELYSIPNCKHSLKIEDFLQKNNIQFKKIMVNDEQIKKEIKRLIGYEKDISFLKITRNHSINLIDGFNEHAINMEIIEHIKKDHPKIEV